MAEKRHSTPPQRRKLTPKPRVDNWRCSRCPSRFKSSTAVDDHLIRLHAGEGFGYYQEQATERKLRYSRKQLYTRTRKPQ